MLKPGNCTLLKGKAYGLVTKHLYFREVGTEGFPGVVIILVTAS